MTETIFTKVINREIPADIIYEDDETLAFKDINPQAPIHYLIIPKKIIPTVNNLDTDDEALVGKLFSAARHIAAKEGFAEAGYRCVINCNQAGGQEVYHLHLHLLAGRQMQWPPG